MTKKKLVTSCKFRETDSYVTALALDASRQRLAALRDNNFIQIFNNDLQLIHKSQLASELQPNINNLLWNGANELICAGLDGIVRQIDVRVMKDTKLCTMADNSILTLDLYDNLLAVGSDYRDCNSRIMIWDKRKLSTPLLHYKEAHSDDITTVKFNKISPSNQLISGSMDGTLHVYDTKSSNEDECIVNTFNHNSSISKADFISKSRVLVLSHMNTLSVYNITNDIEDTKDNDIDFGDLRHGLDVQYVADFEPHGDKQFYLLAGSSDISNIKLFKFKFNSRRNNAWSKPYVKDNAHNKELVRCATVDKEAKLIYTGGEDGGIEASRMRLHKAGDQRPSKRFNPIKRNG